MSMSLVNPLYEMGINCPINQKSQELQTSVTFVNEFKAGDKLPVSFIASGDIIQLQSSEQTITFMKDLFMRTTVKGSSQEILFSLDQNSWKPFQEIVTGSISAKIEQSSTEEAKAIIHLFTNAV